MASAAPEQPPMVTAPADAAAAPPAAATPATAAAAAVAAPAAAAPADAVTGPAKTIKKDKPHSKRVSLWNVVYRRRICGNSAPMEQNLGKYLARHPECEVYCGQDLPTYTGGNGEAKRTAALEVLAARPARQIQKRVTLWHKVQKRKVVGNAAPLEKNVEEYLRKHPEFELYDASGDEREKNILRAVERVLGAIVTSVASMHKQDASQQPRAPKQPRQQKGKSGRQLAAAPRLKGAATKPSGSRKRAPGGRRSGGVLTAHQPNSLGVSLLLSIAMEQGSIGLDDGESSAAEDDAADDTDDFGLLDLLAAATDSERKSAAASSSSSSPRPAAAAGGKPAAPPPAASPSSPPESPPFSPMSGPEADNIAVPKQLSIGPAHEHGTRSAMSRRSPRRGGGSAARGMPRSASGMLAQEMLQMMQATQHHRLVM